MHSLPPSPTVTPFLFITLQKKKTFFYYNTLLPCIPNHMQMHCPLLPKTPSSYTQTHHPPQTLTSPTISRLISSFLTSCKRNMTMCTPLSFVVLALVILVALGATTASAQLWWGNDTFSGPDNGGGSVARRWEMVPAMFVFGDSLIDNGNNNNLPSFAKANYFPYGIDFNGGPTGRFSNGYTMVDEIAQLLGLPLIPPYSEASGNDLLHGVNYASAAAGILDATGGNFVGRIPFNQQIQNFQNTLDQITGNLGADDLSRALSRCLFFIGMGSNDYLNNYLMPNYDTKNIYNAQQFADLLTGHYSRQLTTLYNLGARKFVLSGIGQMGCIPSILAQNMAGACSEEVNSLVQPFNTNVRTMMKNLNTNLPEARFVFIDIAGMFQDLVTNARSHGFSVVNRGCCGIGRNRGQITCLPFQTPCTDRERYIFWDAFHPTEAVNVLMARKAFNGDLSISYPINIEQLANL